VNISKFLVAFGFLFMGLDYMKTSVDDFSDAIDPAVFAGYGAVVFALVGPGDDSQLCKAVQLRLPLC
jgi:phosphate:Na+ symporter